ncbi:M14 family zinc carboxypeptidase [Colwelliaceae bacterium 6471]
MRLTISLFISLLLLSALATAAPISQYLPKGHEYNNKVVKPSDVFGFEIGDRHVRHGQMLEYMKSLADYSPRVMLTNIGKTVELRQQILLTVSAPKNLAKLDDILAQRQLTGGKKAEQQPLVIWLGYSVHGDEISGTNAAMLVAYHLAASQESSIAELLDNAIIVMEPSINPDGMDRFVNWVNTYRGTSLNSDANHIEHHQGWRTGRTNHFGFDLNRDWLLLSQQESQHRLKYFHLYKPNVLGDFHEMGANGSYFFQPGIPTRNHPLTPKENTALTQKLALYHAEALDKENRLYYSEESFDDFYYGKGSTYPDINASVGILFEQASSRGMQQETQNGLLTFEFGIKNHVLTSLSTIKGAWLNRDELKEYRQNFYQESQKQAKKEEFSGYLIHEKFDQHRLASFLDKLKQHQIDVFPLADDFRYDSTLYSKEHSFYVPLEQPQYRVIKALFGQETDFQDNTFYDVSGWTMPLAMNIEFYPVKRTWGLKLSDNQWTRAEKVVADIDLQAYGYAFEWHDFLAPRLLNKLLANDIKAKVATKSFTVADGSVNHQFSAGSIVIPAGIQTNVNWRNILATASNENHISITSLTSGYTAQGIDIGSGSLKLLKEPKVLLVGGKGISQYEAGEILFYLDDTLNMPVSVVEHQRLKQIDLSTYTHLLLVDGDYAKLDVAMVNVVESFGKQGGVIFAQKRAAKWLAEKGVLTASFVSNTQIDQLFDTENLNYQDKDKLAGRKRIAGAIFESVIDTSHPLAYGYTSPNLPLFRNSTLIMNQPSQPFVTVAKYSEEPLMSGYADRNLVLRIANNAAIVAHNLGKGRVIATSDNLTFRGYWYGSAKLLSNAIFFGKAFNAPVE